MIQKLRIFFMHIENRCKNTFLPGKTDRFMQIAHPTEILHASEYQEKINQTVRLASAPYRKQYVYDPGKCAGRHYCRSGGILTKVPDVPDRRISSATGMARYIIFLYL